MQLSGYHGTNATRAQSILQSNFRTSVRSGLWLGDGIYFFQDAPQHARKWAVEICAKLNETPAVVQAKLSTSNMIDLTDIHYWELLRELYYVNVKDDNERQQLGMRFLFAKESEYNKHYLGANFVDYRLMNVFIKYMISHADRSNQARPKLIRAAFVEGAPVHPDSWLFDRAAVIISVFDPSAISATVILPQ